MYINKFLFTVIILSAALTIMLLISFISDLKRENRIFEFEADAVEELKTFYETRYRKLLSRYEQATSIHEANTSDYEIRCATGACSCDQRKKDGQ